MKLKLDENLGDRGRSIFADAGHDVATVTEQGLAGAVDDRVIEVCRVEGRALITLDLDFSNPFVFPPDKNAGIAVLRLPRQPSLNDLRATMETLVTRMEAETFERKLWIVERGRVREYLPGAGS